MIANRTALAVLAIRIVSIGLGALLTIVITRYYGMIALGNYAILMLFVSFAALPTKGAISSIVFRELAKSKTESEQAAAGSLIHFAYRFTSLTLPLAVLLAILFLSRISLGETESIKIIFAAALVVMFLEGFTTIQISVLRGLDRSLEAQVLDGIARPLCVLIVIVVLAFTSLGEQRTEAVVLGYALGLVAVRLLCSARLFGKTPKNNRAMTYREFSNKHGIQAGLFLGNSFAATSIASFDVIVGAIVVPIEHIGIYKIILQLCIFANTLYIGLNFLISRQFAGLRLDQNDRITQLKAVELTSVKFARLSTIFAVVSCIFLFAAGPELVRILFTVVIDEQRAIFLIVGGAMIVNSAFGMASAFLMMNHDEAFVFKWSTITLLACLPVCIPLGAYFGMYGMGLSLLLVTFVWNFGLSIRAKRKFSFNSTIF